MYEFYNPNPLNKSVGDCVIRALSKALDKSWNDTAIELYIFAYDLKDMPSSNFVWGKFLNNYGFVKKLIPDDCPNCYTINNFVNDFNKGVYVIGTGTHVVTAINGVYYDSWNSGDETPLYYFEKGMIK